jgi:hypothetical protein
MKIRCDCHWRGTDAGQRTALDIFGLGWRALPAGSSRCSARQAGSNPTSNTILNTLVLKPQLIDITLQ